MRSPEPMADAIGELRKERDLKVSAGGIACVVVVTHNPQNPLSRAAARIMRFLIIPALVHQNGLRLSPLLPDTRAIAATGSAAVRTFTFLGPHIPQCQARGGETCVVCYRHRSSRAQSLACADGAIPCRTTEEQWYSKEAEKTMDGEGQGDRCKHLSSRGLQTWRAGVTLML